MNTNGYSLVPFLIKELPMTTSVDSVHRPHCACCHEDHCTPKKDTKSFNLQKVIELVCRVALTAIALYAHPISTGVGMAAGLSYGLYVGYLKYEKGEEFTSGSDSGCAHGFLEELSGVRFPKALNTLAAFGITLEHLMDGCGGHHGHSHIPFSIFGALAGLSSGAWIGHGLWYAGREIQAWSSQPSQPALID
jgi:hypothetical protein